MDLRLQRAIRCMFFGSGVISFQVAAEVDPSGSLSVASVYDGPGGAVDFYMSEAGMLISIVLIALVVIARSGKRP